MSNLKITIGVVLYAGVKYLPHGLKSLIEQDYQNVELLVLDQEEGKWTGAKWIKENHPEWLKKITLIEGENLWHSGGFNKLIGLMSGDVFVVASQDMLYSVDFASRLAKFFDQHQEYQFATARLMRWDFANLIQTEEIDSLGLQVNQKHQAFEIGQGKKVSNTQLTNAEITPIFGATGALFAMRKSAIEKVKFNGQVFDEKLHYKNDVDLSYRLQWAGCHGALINDLVVYHDRFIAKNSSKPFWVKKQSLFGDIWFVKKNFSWNFSWSCRLQTMAYLLAKTLFLVITGPRLISALTEVWSKRSLLRTWQKNEIREISAVQMEQRLRGNLIVST